MENGGFKMPHRNHKKHHLMHELEEEMDHLEIQLTLARIEDRS